MQPTHPTQAKQPTLPTPPTISALPITPALMVVAADPITPALPDTAALPITPAEPATAALPDLVVCASGNLALIFFGIAEGRLTLEQIEAVHPGLVSYLAGHPGIGMILVNTEAEGSVVLGPAVRRLAARDRRILELRFFQGWTQEQIAQDIGVTQMQVSRLLSRILKDLRAELS